MNTAAAERHTRRLPDTFEQEACATILDLYCGFAYCDVPLDGESLSLSVRFADEKTLRAYGNNAFTEGYREGVSEINVFFETWMEKSCWILCQRHIERRLQFKQCNHLADQSDHSVQCPHCGRRESALLKHT